MEHRSAMRRRSILMLLLFTLAVTIVNASNYGCNPTNDLASEPAPKDPDLTTTTTTTLDSSASSSSSSSSSFASLPTTTIILTTLNEDGCIQHDSSVLLNYERIKDSQSINISKSGFKSSILSRGYIEFDTSSIPDDNWGIRRVILQYTLDSSTKGSGCDINGLSERPSTAGDETLYNDIGNGTSYTTDSNYCQQTLGEADVNLSNAIEDFVRQLTENWFGLGMKLNDEDSNSIHMINSSESPTPPRMVVVLVTNPTSSSSQSSIIQSSSKASSSESSSSESSSTSSSSSSSSAITTTLAPSGDGGNGGGGNLPPNKPRAIRTTITELEQTEEQQPEESCSDGIRNQGEEKIDCGGPCTPCPTQATTQTTQKTTTIQTTAASSPGTTTTQFRETTTPRVDHCNDGIKNYGETDVDCGGSCKPCTPLGIIGRVVQYIGNGTIALPILLILGVSYVLKRKGIILKNN